MHIRLLCFSILLFLFFSCQPNSISAKKPNILLIVADDLGFTDLGCYGSEIRTPNVDALAKGGSRFTSFCTGPTCSPTRGMLLSGVVAHRNGFGTMNGDWADNQRGLPGYEGYLNFDIVTFPKLLQNAGYHTSTVGKWHLSAPATAVEQLPINRGFTRSFSLMPGGGGHFEDMQPMFSFWDRSSYARDSNMVSSLPENFYSSKNYADIAISYIDESKEQDKSFFQLLSFTAPHWPLQVPAEHVDLYKGQYKDGYEKLAETRLAKAKEKGVIPAAAKLPALGKNVVPWAELSPEERQKSSRKMEIYAAMIERLDYHTGRVVEHLKRIGEYENTIIIFMADNGAEGNSIMTYEGTGEWVDSTFDNSLDNMGKKNSYIELGPGWAGVSSLPFRWYKAFTTEGGLRVPAIVNYPEWEYERGAVVDDFVHVLDLAPTFLDIADVKHPESQYEGRNIHAMDGTSILPWLEGNRSYVHDDDKAHVWELYGRRGVRKGRWKAEWLEPPYGISEWELYDLTTDLGEENNLAQEQPEKLAELIKDWEVYEKTNDVAIPDYPTAYAKETYWRD